MSGTRRRSPGSVCVDSNSREMARYPHERCGEIRLVMAAKWTRRDVMRAGAAGLCLPLLSSRFGFAVPSAPKVDPIRFRNVASSAGVHFTVENSPTPEKHLIESMPGGLALFDYNGDGLPDIFFTNGAEIGRAHV